MANICNYAEDLMLTWLFTTTAVTRPTAWYAQLHLDDPGETGAANPVTTSEDADIVRKSVTFDDPVADSGQALSNIQAAWTAASGSPGYTIKWVTIWDAVTGGNCLFKGMLAVPFVMAASGIFTLEAGKIVPALD